MIPSQPPTPAAHSPLAGIGLRLLAVFLITCMSATIHMLAADIPIGQLMFWRSSVALIPIIIYMMILGQFPRELRTKHPRLHVTRSVFGAASMAMSFLSLAYLPVANAQALAFLAPVLMLPMAAFLLGEKLSRWVIVAVALGFSGVLAILWHELQTPGDLALVGIAAGLGFAVTTAFTRVHIKAMVKTEKAGTIVFYFAIVSSLMGLATLPLGWVAVSGSTLGWLVFAGLLGGLAHIAATEAVVRAPISTLAAFDFTGMIWAIGFDVVLFAAHPGPLSLVGIALITGAGLLVSLKK